MSRRGKEGDCQPVNVGQNNTVTVQTEVERRRWPQQSWRAQPAQPGEIQAVCSG
ncbi:hypothetical protein PRBEI_2001416400 [Prionailurus iriomotensis]